MKISMGDLDKQQKLMDIGTNVRVVAEVSPTQGMGRVKPKTVRRGARKIEEQKTVRNPKANNPVGEKKNVSKKREEGWNIICVNRAGGEVGEKQGRVSIVSARF